MRHEKYFTYFTDLPPKEGYSEPFDDPIVERITDIRGLICKVWLADVETRFTNAHFRETAWVESFGNAPVVEGLAAIDLEDL